MDGFLKVFTATILPCLLAGVATAQILQPIGEFTENLDENATNISGASLVGVQRVGAEIEVTELLAYLPEGWEETVLCLRVTTANGRYETIVNYRFTPGEEAARADSYIPIDFPTDHGAYLRDQGAHRVAAQLTGGPCEEAGHPATVVVWGDEAPEPVELLINTFGANETFVYLGGGASALACRKVQGQGRSAFDTLCELKPALPKGSVTLEIVRYFNGIPSEPDVFHLALPDR